MLLIKGKPDLKRAATAEKSIFKVVCNSIQLQKIKLLGMWILYHKIESPKGNTKHKAIPRLSLNVLSSG